MNPYSFAENIINASEELIGKAHESSGFVSKEEIVTMLMLLEICLDKSRAVAPVGSASSSPDEKKLVEQKLDAIRKEIAALVKEVDQAKFKESKRQIIAEVETNFQ